MLATILTSASKRMAKIFGRVTQLLLRPRRLESRSSWPKLNVCIHSWLKLCPQQMAAGNPKSMFSGSRVYLVPTGMGKPRVQLFLKKLAEHGAEIVNSEKDATHVVVAECVDRERLPKLIDAEKLTPSATIVRCAWISDSLKTASLASTQPYALTWDLPHEHGETVADSDCASSSNAEMGKADSANSRKEPERSAGSGEIADPSSNCNAHIIEQLEVGTVRPDQLFVRNADDSCLHSKVLKERTKKKKKSDGRCCRTSPTASYHNACD